MKLKMEYTIKIKTDDEIADIERFNKRIKEAGGMTVVREDVKQRLYEDVAECIDNDEGTKIIVTEDRFEVID